MEGRYLLSGILESMEEGTLVLDEQGRLICWNQQLLKMFHLPPANPLDVNHPEYILDPIVEHLSKENDIPRLLSSPGTLERPVLGTCQLPGGRHAKWKVQNFSISENSKGQICTFREKAGVGPKKDNATHQLIANNEKLQKIIKSSPDSIVITDLDGYITYYNDETARMYECEEDGQLTGVNVFELICEEDRSNASTYMQQALKNGTVKNRESRIKSCRGRMIEIEASVSSLEQSNGDPVAFIIISQDVTERKMIRKLLQEREKKFRSIFDHAQDGIILIDPEGYHLDSNRSALELVGYSRKDIKGVHFTRIIAPDQHQKSQQIMEGLRSGMEGGSYEKTFIRRDGRRIPVEMTVSPLLDSQGRLYCILSVIRDISERKHFEQQLIQAKQKAEESDNLKSAFLANMSHEIRTPMNGIMGFAGMLKRNDLSQQKRNHFINIINNSADQLMGIIHDIIDISMLETGQQKILRETFNLNLLMQETYTLFRSRAGEKNLEFTWHKGLQDQKSLLTTDKTKLSGLSLS